MQVTTVGLDLAKCQRRLNFPQKCRSKIPHLLGPGDQPASVICGSGFCLGRSPRRFGGGCGDHRFRPSVQERTRICGLAGAYPAQSLQRWQGTIGQDHQDGRPISAAAHRGRHDVPRPTGRQSPGARRSLARGSVATKTGTPCHRRHGQQNGSDHVGRADQERTLQAARGLTEGETTEIARPTM